MNRFHLSSNSIQDQLLKSEPEESVTTGFGWQREEAEQVFQKAYEKQMQGAIEEAKRLYKQSLEFYPTAEAHTFLGWALSMQGKYEEAILECQKAIGVDHDYGNPFNDIGAYLIELGRDDEAVIWLEKALEAKRYDAFFYPHYNLGRIWEKRGEWFKAFEAYSQALDYKPDYTLAKSALGRLRALMN